MRSMFQKLAAIVALAGLLCCAVFGAQTVPGAVLSARESTVRIISKGDAGIFSGTGFTVERNSCYVITNYHVVEDCDEFAVYLSRDAMVRAVVKATSPGADLAVLKTEAPLKVPGLALRTGGIDTGLAIWTLGFPDGADTLAGQPVAGVDEMTVTDGIVSAVQTSYAVGTGSQPVKVVQTNAAINHGNSGGPMVDEHGRVVGINTIGISNVQNINGAVHVTELINVLEANGIPYKTAWGRGFAVWGAVLALCLAGAAVGLYFYRKKGGHWLPDLGPRSMSLEQFVRAGHRLAPAEAARAVADAVQAKGAQAYGFCSPQCVRVSGRRVKLKRKNRANFRAPGFTAPETYYGVQAEPGGVYFFGAVLYALTEGAVPPDVPARMNGAPLILSERNPLRFFIENAMQMQAGRRTQSLAQFGAELAALAARLEKVQENKQTAEPAVVQPHAFVPVAVQEAATAADAAPKMAPEEERPQGQPPTVAQAEEQAAQPVPQKPKRRLRKRVIVAAVALVVLAVPAGFGIYAWRQAEALETAISYGQYGQAQAVYRRAPWLRMQDEQRAAYVDAQVLMAQGELEPARQAFLALEDYQDSAQLAENIKTYLIASDHPKSLGALRQYEYFIGLGNFLDSHSRALACLPNIEEEGIDWYENWRFSRAKEAFTVLAQYEESDVVLAYLAACEIGEEIERQYVYEDRVRYTYDQMETMRWIDDYIDITPLVDYNMHGYLYGDWYSVSGNYMWFYDDGFETGFYIPLGSYYFQMEGLQYVDSGQYYATWECVDFDTLYVTVNGRSEYYYRAV